MNKLEYDSLEIWEQSCCQSKGQDFELVSRQESVHVRAFSWMFCS